MTAYFIPVKDTISALMSAVDRSVSVEVMLLGHHIDSTIVLFGSRSCWGKLLRAGVQIHIYQPTMLHAKVTVVDHSWIIIGSANFDNRSFFLNGEIIANVCDEEFASKRCEIFRQNCEHCKPCSYDDWLDRGQFSCGKEALSDSVRAHL